MSEKCKTLMRPKVRFSQGSESTDSVATGPFAGPKIKNIIGVDKPVKFIRGVSQQDLPKIRQENAQTNPSNDTNKALITSAPHLTETVPCKIIAGSRSCPKIPPNGPQKFPLRSATKNPTAVRGRSSDRKEANKENRARSISKSKTEKLLPKLSKLHESKTSSKSITSSVISSMLKKTLPVPQKPTNLTSTKAKTSTVKSKNAQVKAPARSKSQARTTVVRNITGVPQNVYVGPGVPKQRTKSPLLTAEAFHQRPDIIKSDDLDRPEYNTIVHTIKKLQQVTKEKIVPNFEQLPSTYKSAFLKKVTSALDFPASESIFHNLIDLSIDENQLPMRLTRSRDPEPREKDLVPTLNDFFVPQYAPEYCEAVKIKPQHPEIIDSWSAFRISNRVNYWKACLDEI